MLSVGAIRFEDRFCASERVGQREVGQGEVGQGEVGQGEVGQGEVGQGEVGQGEVGGATAVADCAWRLLQLAIEKARSARMARSSAFLYKRA